MYVCMYVCMYYINSKAVKTQQNIQGTTCFSMNVLGCKPGVHINL